MCATQFDIDETGDVISPLDMMVKRKLIKKHLENDNLYYIEGGILKDHRNYVNIEKLEQEMRQDKLEEQAWENGDC